MKKLMNVLLTFSYPGEKTRITMSAIEVEVHEEAAKRGWLMLRPTKMAGEVSEVEVKAEEALSQFDDDEEEEV